MNSALRNQQAMASAQAAYDNALPVDDLDFLDDERYQQARDERMKLDAQQRMEP